MLNTSSPFVRIQGALDAGDLEYLKAACKRHLSREGIPCYVLIDHLESPTCVKIKACVERLMGRPVYYLNDFYMYTDESFRTDWHMDTELFTFASAVNAWILLSPDCVADPLVFVNGVNDSPDRIFHSARIEGDECLFGDHHSGRTLLLPLATLRAEQIHTPRIDVGDILVLNPQRFHRTNSHTPKHSIAIKFVMKGPDGFASADQVDPFLWPEVGLFNTLLQDAEPWERFIDGVRRMLRTEQGRKELSAGFYPQKFELYRNKVMSL